MRTTVEIKDEHRAKLLELAARRGEKGFSRLIGDAIEAYLRSIQERDRARRNALRLRGTVRRGEAQELRDRVEELRAVWR